VIDWRIRRATQEDADALVVLEAKSFGVRSWGEKNIRESLAVPNVGVLLAEADAGAPSGFVIWRDLGGEAEILSLGVPPAHQRRGAGDALVAAIVAAARDAGAARIFLEVDAGNAPAIDLYGKSGFTASGRRKGYYRDGADAVLMHLLL